MLLKKRRKKIIEIEENITFFKPEQVRSGPKVQRQFKFYYCALRYIYKVSSSNDSKIIASELTNRQIICKNLLLCSAVIFLEKGFL